MVLPVASAYVRQRALRDMEHISETSFWSSSTCYQLKTSFRDSLGLYEPEKSVQMRALKH